MVVVADEAKEIAVVLVMRMLLLASRTKIAPQQMKAVRADVKTTIGPGPRQQAKLRVIATAKIDKTMMISNKRLITKELMTKDLSVVVML